MPTAHPQEFQRASQESTAAATALQQVQLDVQELAAVQQQVLARHDVIDTNTSSCSKKLQEFGQQMQQLDVRVSGQAADLQGLAESVLGCLSAARAHAAAADAPQGPSSYLSSLLGPAMTPPVTTAPPGHAPSWNAWVSVCVLLLIQSLLHLYFEVVGRRLLIQTYDVFCTH